MIEMDGGDVTWNAEFTQSDDEYEMKFHVSFGLW